MNVIKLKEYLANNPDDAISLIEGLGFANITHNRIKNQLRFAKEYGSNPTSICLHLDTLQFRCFSTDSRGDIITLIMQKENLDFRKALNYVVTKLKLNEFEFNVKIKLPFNGFYKNIIKQQDEPESLMKTYDEGILDEYVGKYSMMFYHDGVSIDIQERFCLGYDFETGRIAIPVRNFNGELVGIMGRLNDSRCDKSERWLPIIPFSRSQTLYGWSDNYNAIKESNAVVILEAEKSVMQLASMGLHIGLATGGCGISETQARYIKSLLVDKVIIAYDEGLAEEVLIKEAKKIMLMNLFHKSKVGYILDAKNEILPKGSKASPTDLGKESLKCLMTKYIKWM